MTVRTRLPLVIAVLGMLVVSGCTTTSPGTPMPVSPTSDAESSDEPGSGGELPSDGAPKVENPLDVSHFEQNPCDALTSQDAETLNVPVPGEQDGDSSGESCYWQNSESRGSVSLSFLSGDKRGLSSVYREANGGKYAYFEPITDVEGHPAVAFNPNAENPTIDCGVMVGVTDRLVFLTRIALSDANVGREKPCEVAANVAGMMMKTMQESS